MYKRSPRDLIRIGAQNYGDRLAAIATDENLTYQQLAFKTANLASELKQAGIDTGIQVALILPNSIAYLVWYFAVLEAGGIVVPLAPTLTLMEVKRLIESSNIQFLAAPEKSSIPQGIGTPLEIQLATVTGVGFWRVESEGGILKPIPGDTDDFVTRQFSSGSTGRPKHMLKSAENIAHDYWHFCATLELKDGERFLGVTPFNHAYGAISFLAAFHLGGCVILLPRFFSTPVLEASSKYQPTVYLATPPMIEVLGTCRLEEGEDEAFRSLKACICSTGHLQKAAYDTFYGRFKVPIKVQYGSTESLSTTIDLDDGFEERRVGRPYKEVTIGIFGDDGHPCAAEEQGRIGIASPAACNGYIDDPENSDLTFQNGYLFPGDKGYLDREGRLYVLGRSDIINIGGYKVDHLEVETVIREALPIIDVIVVEGKRHGLPVIRAIVEADPTRVTRSMVIAACRERLAMHKVPTLVEINDRLDRDTNGKVLSSSLYD